MQHWVQRGVAKARHSEGVLTLELGGGVGLSMGRRTALELVDAVLEALRPPAEAAEAEAETADAA